MQYFLCLILFSFNTIVLSQTAEDVDRCISKNTCGECLQVSKCSWNIRPPQNQAHCNATGTYATQEIINPQTNGFLMESSKGDHINVKKMYAKIRRGDSYSFRFNYKHKTQYPLDIYFLMDMSKSMQYYRDRISVLAAELVRKMKLKSNDVKIGFGSFVDKTALPYVNAVENEIIKPCPNCELPYSFKNHLPLDSSIDRFSRLVNETPISANIDGPEGSLEALLQVIVCSGAIGWRENARHLVILSTDDSFHVAGDGKLAGIVEPNDGECHLVNNEYTFGLKQDYPSIGQIQERSLNKSINILYIVPPAQEILYRKLQKTMKNSYLGVLQSNFDNIVNLVEDFYDQITASVTFVHNFEAPDFSVKLSSKDCTKFKNNTCNDIANNESYEILVKIEFNSCPNDKIFKRTFFIKPETLQEQVDVVLDLVCDCPCEHPDHEDFEKDSEKCSKQGNLECGVCNCKEGKIGQHCQCDSKSFLQNIDDSNCQKPGTNEECSGNGQCKCGQCICNTPFSGLYCHCNDNLCLVNNEVCSNHGTCSCGKCSCNEEWSGNKCDCSTEKDSCVHPGNRKICSGNGECICGKCVCTDKVKYGGQYCQECKTCPKACDDFKDCVRCFYSSKDCELNCKRFEIYETLETMNISETEKICNYQEDEYCFIKFAFAYNQTEGIAEIYTQKVCTPTQAGMKALFSIIGAFLIMGIIAFIIWKIITEMSYRREYEKFINESKTAKWSTEENPLFKNAVSEFQNPLFKKAN